MMTNGHGSRLHQNKENQPPTKLMSKHTTDTYTTKYGWCITLQNVP